MRHPLAHRRARTWGVLLLAVGVTGAAAGTCGPVVWNPADLLFHGDVYDFQRQRPAEILPDLPWIRRGPDGVFGTGDDVIRTDRPGDIDLVLRTGITGFTGAIPDPTGASPALPVAVAEPFAAGAPVDFVVTASDGRISAYGAPIDPPSLAGVPVLVVAFADLDDDGYVGVTLLDGDPLDAAAEEEELLAVGRRLAMFTGGRASGQLHIRAGGPAGARLRIAVGAAAYSGAFDPSFKGGNVPTGAAVTTQLPFLPVLDPDAAIDTGNAPGPADPFELAAVNVLSEMDPDPSHPVLGESFTLAVDGSEPTIDLAVARSGAFARCALAIALDLVAYPDPQFPLRPGLDDSGARVLFGVPHWLSVPDDGLAGLVSARIVPADTLGNIADPHQPVAVTLRSAGPARIASPDTDGDPTVEALLLDDARGVAVLIDDGGGLFDDANQGSLTLECGTALAQIDTFVPDPDVDDNGLVETADADLVASLDGSRVGDPGFVPAYDLTGDGRIADDDVAFVNLWIGTAIPQP